MRLVTLAPAASLALLVGLPAGAAQYRYTVSAVPFNNDAGPAQSGFFSGSFVWDTAANGGVGAFTSWNLVITKGGSTVQTLTSSPVGAGVTSGCFKGPPIGAGGALPGAGTYDYAIGAAGTSLCDGETAGVSGKATTLSVYQFGQSINTGGGGSGTFSFFRLALGGNVLNQRAGSNFAAASFGYAVLASDPSAPSCTFASNSETDNSPPAGACPYASGTQRRQAFASSADVTFNSSVTTQPVSVPAPLSVLGAGSALAWSRRLRRRIKRGRVALLEPVG